MTPSTVWLVVALFIAFGAFAAPARSGELDPPASALTPQGTPAPTMKSLDQVPGAWDRLLSAQGADACNSERFKCVMNGTAVLDRETALVWERSPNPSRVIWYDARNSCFGRTTGGRKGWRLPALHELASLVQHDVPFPGPTLPSGHPFLDVLNADGVTAEYWTATGGGSMPGAPALHELFPQVFIPVPQVWAVSMSAGDSQHVYPVVENFRSWCVRGRADGPDIQ